MTRQDWVLLAAALGFAVAIVGAASEGKGDPLPIPSTGWLSPGSSMIATTAVGTTANPDWRAPDGRDIPTLIAAHVLPDPAVTPGAVNPDWAAGRLTLAQVCKPGWTATVRPPASWTDKLRAQDTPAGHQPADGELDHLRSIEDLGAPADPANLWWMVYADRYGARVKDVLETKLHRLLCAGKITPDDATAALVPNWLAGYQRYVGPLP